MTKVRAPMLLDGNMQEVRRLEPSGLMLSLNLAPPSTADMTIPFDVSDPVSMRSWIRLYDIHGDAGVYRVSASDTEYENNEQRLTLEHSITSLRDKVVPSLSDAGANSEVKKTASEMLTWLLGKQDVVRWSAGSCAASENVILDQNGSTLFEMLVEMMDQLPEYDLSFSQSSYPWTVSIVSKAVNVTAEGRLSRNLESVRVTYDDSELCTRVWYNIKDNDNPQHMDASTISTYGIVDGSLYLNTDTKKDEATRIATRYREIRKEPAISVEIDAVDLSVATGEQIDAFTLGKKFRLTIPAYGLIVNQWITGLRYSDVYGASEHVTITLGNRIADIAQRAAKTAKAAKSAGKSSSGGGAGGARNNAAVIKQDRVVLSDHNTTIVAIRQGASAWREMDSSLTINDAILRMFSYTRDLYGDEAQNKTGIIETLSQAGITVDSSRSMINLFTRYLEYTKDGIDRNTANITLNRSNISLKVDKNGVIASINLSPEGVVIDAAKVDLGDYATVGQLEALKASVQYLLGETVTFTGSVWVRGGFSHSGSHLTLLNTACSWKEQEVVTSASLGTTSSHEFQKMGGTYVTGKLVTSWSSNKTTIYYIGHS